MPDHGKITAPPNGDDCVNVRHKVCKGGFICQNNNCLYRRKYRCLNQLQHISLHKIVMQENILLKYH